MDAPAAPPAEAFTPGPPRGFLGSLAGSAACSSAFLRAGTHSFPQIEKWLPFHCPSPFYRPPPPFWTLFPVTIWRYQVADLRCKGFPIAAISQTLEHQVSSI